MLKGPPRDTIKAVILTDRKGGMTLFAENFSSRAKKITANTDGKMVAITNRITGIGSLPEEFSEIGMMNFSPSRCAIPKIIRLAAVAAQVIKIPV